MINDGLASSVIHRSSPGDGYIRVRDGGLITAVARFLYDEVALLDEWRLDEWLALFHPNSARYLFPSPEDFNDDPATTLPLVNDSMRILAGRITRLMREHAHAESPRRRIADLRVWRGPAHLLSRSVFDVTRVRRGAVDRYVRVYEHQLLPGDGAETPWLIGRRRVLIDRNIESAGGQISILI